MNKKISQISIISSNIIEQKWQGAIFFLRLFEFPVKYISYELRRDEFHFQKLNKKENSLTPLDETGERYKGTAIG